MILRWQQLSADFRLCSILLHWVPVCPKIFTSLQYGLLVSSDDKDRLVIRKQDINFWKVLKGFFGLLQQHFFKYTNYTSFNYLFLRDSIYSFTVQIWFELHLPKYIFLYTCKYPDHKLCTCCWDLYVRSPAQANAKKTSKFWVNLHRDINYPGYSKP